MTQTLGATFDGVVFRPDKPVKIKPNTHVQIVVKTDDTANKTVADLAGHLFGIIDVEAPSDISTNKKYLEGFGE
jgi:predicted DNA-binding antitoxin AbrB/MazE fold protein